MLDVTAGEFDLGAQLALDFIRARVAEAAAAGLRAYPENKVNEEAAAVSA